MKSNKNNPVMPVDFVTKFNILLANHSLKSIFNENEVKDIAKWSINVFLPENLQFLNTETTNT